ncbi:three-helix bundle dimerization domain-containing protein [Blastococcus sp. SYSU DS0533]
MTLVVPPSPSGPAGDPTAPAEPAVADDAVSAAVVRLSGEYSGRIGHPVVVRVVRDCRRDLGGSPVGALPELVERLARYRLDRCIG